MSCKTKDLTLDHFKDEKLISNDRVILDMNKFDSANKYFTNLAEEVHGLDPKGQMLFDVTSSETTVAGRDAIYSRKKKTYFAEPVDELFETLDELVIKNDITEDEAIRTIKDRKPVRKTVNVGNKYRGENAQHFTTSEADKSNINKRVKVSNEGFINQSEDKVFFDRLVTEYQSRTGRKFNINNNTKAGVKVQNGFYNFLNSKGIKGVEVFDSNNDLHMVKFNADETIEFSDDIMDKPVITDTFTEGVEVTEAPMKRSQLEDLEWYEQSELDSLYTVYTPAQINQMIAEDMQNAQDVFNEYLYGQEADNAIFVSNRDVNDQINNCK